MGSIYSELQNPLLGTPMLESILLSVNLKSRDQGRDTPATVT